MKTEEEKNLNYQGIRDEAPRILNELNEYLSNLQNQRAAAELKYANADRLLKKKSEEFNSMLVGLNQRLKEEKASWSSKERSYESKIKALTDENEKLKRRLNKVSQSDVYYVGYEVGNIAAEESRIASNRNAAQDLWKEVEDLRSKIDKNYVEVEHLEQSIKEYTDEKGYDEAYEIFERLNTLLAGVDAWTAANKRLKSFFREKKKEIKSAGGNRTINITGDHPTYNENNND